jgi:predicted aldo/keto reductase-like oxidoreductase
VTVVLSGMNSMSMVRENCRVASEAAVGGFTQADFDTIHRVTQCIREKEKVGCTGCRYCMPCPHGVDIPGNFHYYNLMYVDSKFEGLRGVFQNMCLREEPGFASQCVACGKCERSCPQHIHIIEELKNADRALRPLPYKIGVEIARKFLVKKSSQEK